MPVLPCSSCRESPASRFQDRRYGTGKRVHTEVGQNKPPEQREVRCTVCGTKTKRRKKEEAKG